LSTQQVKIFLGARVNGIRATRPVHRKSKTLIIIEGLNGKALKEVGRWSSAATLVSDSNAAHGERIDDGNVEGD
jgi:hypothetical protein